jgi:hypothetical protein
MSSTYSAGSEALVSDSSGQEVSELSPSAKLNRSVEKSSGDIGLGFPSTPMSEVSEEAMSGTLTLSAEASPAKTSVTPATEQALKVNDPAYGLNTSGSFANFDPATSSWKTSQHSLFEESTEFSETWPRSGTTRSGKAFQRVPLVPRISATGFGYLPTPDKSLGKNYGIGDEMSCFRVETQGGVRPSGAKIGSSLRWCPEYIRERLRTGGYLNPVWLERLMDFPDRWTDAAPSETLLSPESPK